jgi:hypothetical protein
MVKIILLFDAILRYQLLCVGIILGHAGDGDVGALENARGENGLREITHAPALVANWPNLDLLAWPDSR